MTRPFRLVAACVAVIALAGCGSSGSSSSSTTAAAGSGSSGTTAGSSAAPSTAPSTERPPITDVEPSGSSDDAFCQKLSDAADKAADMRAAIGTPAFADKLAAVRQDNTDIVASAPAEIRDAVAITNAASELAQQALDPSLSPQQKMDLTQQALAKAKAPETLAAMHESTTWINAHCGAAAAHILAVTGGSGH